MRLKTAKMAVESNLLCLFVVTICALPQGEASLREILSKHELLEINIQEENFAPNKQPGDTIFEADDALEDADRDARSCDPRQCKLPYCRCCGSALSLPAWKIPQAVALTFSTGVGKPELELYEELFFDRLNPNGCPATGTFFVSARYSNYYAVQQLYSRRHEIALNGFSEHSIQFWKNATSRDWEREIRGKWLSRI